MIPKFLEFIKIEEEIRKFEEKWRDFNWNQ